MKRISKNAALQLIKNGAIIVDMRSPVAFRDGHYEGAINLPLRNFLNHIMKLDRKQKIVIYSDYIEDAELKHASSYAETLGFLNVSAIDYKTLTAKTIPAVNPAMKKRMEEAARRPNQKRSYPKFKEA
jgi:rhodanese-related sulfurtransferase